MMKRNYPEEELRLTLAKIWSSFGNPGKTDCHKKRWQGIYSFQPKLL